MYTESASKALIKQRKDVIMPSRGKDVMLGYASAITGTGITCYIALHGLCLLPCWLGILKGKKVGVCFLEGASPFRLV